MKKNNGPKILIWDIETSYSVVKTFSLFKPMISPSQIVSDWFIICGAWKFLGEDKVHSIACTKKGLKIGDDKRVVKALRKAIESADIIIGHNGDKFDLKKLRARVIKHELPPINNIKTIDTLKVARREFNFTSNRLDYIGNFLGVGGKIENEPGLWDKVMAGDMGALDRMVEYNERDVTLLEDVYLRMRPHISNHPDVNVFTDQQMLNPCPNCGSCDTIRNGKRPAMKVKKIFQRRACYNCGTSFLESKPIN